MVSFQYFQMSRQWTTTSYVEKDGKSRPEEISKSQDTETSRRNRIGHGFRFHCETPDEQTNSDHRWLADDPAWPRCAPLHHGTDAQNTIWNSSSQPVHVETIGQGLGGVWVWYSRCYTTTSEKEMRESESGKIYETVKKINHMYTGK